MEKLNKYKILYYSRNVIRLAFFNKIKKKKIIIFNNNSIIPKNFISNIAYVYKGNIFKKIIINNFNSGMRFKYFIVSTKPFNYPIKKKKNYLKR